MLRDCLKKSDIKPAPHPVLNEFDRRGLKVTFKFTTYINGRELLTKPVQKKECKCPKK